MVFQRATVLGMNSIRVENERLTIDSQGALLISSALLKKETFRNPRERRLMNEELKRIPDAKSYPSIHGLINKERVINYFPQLKRNRILDNVARNHAELMCREGKMLLPMNNFAKYNNIDQLSSFAWNVGYGMNKQDIQKSFMTSNITK